MNRGFEYVTRKISTGFEVIEPDFNLPKRQTKNSMAYDFYSPEDFTVEPKQSYMLKTGIKAYMRDDEGLIMNVRSSMGKKHIMMQNTQPWIDSDFYNNQDNEGEIGLLFYNFGEEPWVVNKNDRIAQAMFLQFLKADNDNVDKIRTGGFGSTNA